MLYKTSTLHGTTHAILTPCSVAGIRTPRFKHIGTRAWRGPCMESSAMSTNSKECIMWLDCEFYVIRKLCHGSTNFFVPIFAYGTRWERSLTNTRYSRSNVGRCRSRYTNVWVLQGAEWSGFARSIVPSDWKPHQPHIFVSFILCFSPC
jgi:hypothetical protein